MTHFYTLFADAILRCKTLESGFWRNFTDVSLILYPSELTNWNLKMRKFSGIELGVGVRPHFQIWKIIEKKSQTSLFAQKTRKKKM